MSIEMNQTIKRSVTVNVVRDKKYNTIIKLETTGYGEEVELEDLVEGLVGKVVTITIESN